ncbi:hypothetical protein [Bradyrhizobium sp. LTSPM299]|uniref:hypothetical protein n=1 Tax=Bradyrhizobium sp. LTSPM299 TaxID=1619233 RepID=UPI0012E181E3|nr:hypothetical protein [Bradyrhizobium sp. LTSPM299]
MDKSEKFAKLIDLLVQRHMELLRPVFHRGHRNGLSSMLASVGSLSDASAEQIAALVEAIPKLLTDEHGVGLDEQRIAQGYAEMARQFKELHSIKQLPANVVALAQWRS